MAISENSTVQMRDADKCGNPFYMSTILRAHGIGWRVCMCVRSFELKCSGNWIINVKKACCDALNVHLFTSSHPPIFTLTRAHTYPSRFHLAELVRSAQSFAGEDIIIQDITNNEYLHLSRVQNHNFSMRLPLYRHGIVTVYRWRNAVSHLMPSTLLRCRNASGN